MNACVFKDFQEGAQSDLRTIYLGPPLQLVLNGELVL